MIDHPAVTAEPVASGLVKLCLDSRVILMCGRRFAATKTIDISNELLFRRRSKGLS
jgi:hypothetical protein